MNRKRKELIISVTGVLLLLLSAVFCYQTVRDAIIDNEKESISKNDETNKNLENVSKNDNNSNLNKEIQNKKVNTINNDEKSDIKNNNVNNETNNNFRPFFIIISLLNKIYHKNFLKYRGI